MVERQGMGLFPEFLHRNGARALILDSGVGTITVFVSTKDVINTSDLNDIGDDVVTIFRSLPLDSETSTSDFTIRTWLLLNARVWALIVNLRFHSFHLRGWRRDAKDIREFTELIDVFGCDPEDVACAAFQIWEELASSRCLLALLPLERRGQSVCSIPLCIFNLIAGDFRVSCGKT